MNILIVNTLYTPYKIGGAERSVQLLAEMLAKKGNQVTVATLHDRKDITTDKINNVTIVRFPLANLYWPYDDSNQKKLNRVIWHFRDIYNKRVSKLFNSHFGKAKYDVIHTNNITGFSVSVWHWAKIKNIPIEHTLRDYSLLHPNGTLFKNGKNMRPNSFGGLAFSFVKRYFSKNVDVVVGISEYIKKLHTTNGFFKNAKSVTIFNSTNQQAYKVKHKNKETVFAFLGRVEAEKGIECLLDSFKGLTNCQLKIAGNGKKDYVEYLKEKYGMHNITYLGSVDIQNFFPGIDYLVVPSLWHEPMGRVVIEASSFGVPVIASNRGGIPEIVEENETGYIFSPDSKYELYSALVKSIGNNDEQYTMMSRKSWEYSRHFNSDGIVDEYLEAYKIAMNKLS